jgi:putative transposase
MPRFLLQILACGTSRNIFLAATYKAICGRPHIAFAESLFRTAKYRPEFPTDGFADLGGARAWAARFTHWYNFEHKHSGIQYVSPAQRHAGEDHAILEARHAVYVAAQERNPARWSGPTRDWTPAGPVTLNPERDCVVDLAVRSENRNQKAA